MSLSTSLISVDLVVFRLLDEQLQVLTRKKTIKTGPALVLPSGRIEPEKDDSLDDTASRLLSYLTPHKASYFEQVVTIGDAKRDSRGWSLTVVYYALMNGNTTDYSSDAYWVNVDNDKPNTSLAYDHDALVHEALLRLRNKIQYSSVPVYLLPDEFVLSDIRKVFSAVLEKSPPMRSIRNRFLRGGLLIDTGRQRRGSNRPAAIYKINKETETCLYNRLYLTTQ